MRIFAIGDLHLSGAVEKPMDVFGPAWNDHAGRLSRAWRESVGADDLVLIPGDISWAMQLTDALPDLAFLETLPGKKLLLRGNHDYWWSSVSKVRASLPPSVSALQNGAATYGAFSIGGTRGWTCPGFSPLSAEDDKIYRRELGRMKLSLDAMEPGRRKLVMLHFPPFPDKMRASGFTELFEQYGVERVVYAHLHGAAHKNAYEGTLEGVTYTFVAGDYLGFQPRLLFGEGAE